MSKVHFILYVKDQTASRNFYSAVLEKEPGLDVPGMTEFELMDNVILGLMPETGIKKLLGDKLPDPSSASGIPRAELYLMVDNPEAYLERAVTGGGQKLSDVQERDWGDKAGYCLDPDGHVVAFAKKL